MALNTRQRQIMGGLLEMAADSATPSAGSAPRLHLATVQQALALPPLPYSQFLGPDSWLAGGGVLRWLCGASDQAQASQGGDYDFFFGSLAALNATAQKMVAQGLQVKGYRYVAQDQKGYLRGTFNQAQDSPIWTASGQLAPLTAALIARLRLAYLELQSPQGDTIQLIGDCFDSPLDAILHFDFSICQLAVDDQSLSCGPWTLHDLLQNRWRLGFLKWPRSSFRRMFRYARRGFLPYPSSLLRLSAAALANKMPRPRPEAAATPNLVSARHNGAIVN